MNDLRAQIRALMNFRVDEVDSMTSLDVLAGLEAELTVLSSLRGEAALLRPEEYLLRVQARQRGMPLERIEPQPSQGALKRVCHLLRGFGQGLVIEDGHHSDPDFEDAAEVYLKIAPWCQQTIREKVCV